MKIEVTLLKKMKITERSEYIYRFDNLMDAVRFVDLSLHNGHEVTIRETEE